MPQHQSASLYKLETPRFKRKRSTTSSVLETTILGVRSSKPAVGYAHVGPAKMSLGTPKQINGIMMEYRLIRGRGIISQCHGPCTLAYSIPVASVRRVFMHGPAVPICSQSRSSCLRYNAVYKCRYINYLNCAKQCPPREIVGPARLFGSMWTARCSQVPVLHTARTLSIPASTPAPMIPPSRASRRNTLFPPSCGPARMTSRSI